MRYLRSCAVALALAFLVLPAAPLGGIVPVPTVGGDAAAYIDVECDFYTYAANGGSCVVTPPPPGGGGGGIDGGGLACAASITAGAWAVKDSFNSWLLGVPAGGANVLIGIFGFFGSLVFC